MVLVKLMHNTNKNHLFPNSIEKNRLIGQKRKDILLSLIIPFYNSENTKTVFLAVSLRKKNEKIEIILINWH